MIAKMLGLPETPLVVFLLTAGSATLLFFLLSGLSYYLFFVRGRQTFHPDYEPEPVTIRYAIKWSMIALVGNAALVTPIHLLLAGGYGQLYFDVADHGWGWLVGSAIAMLLLAETTIYWTHRALHSQLLFERIHQKHHEFKVPTPFVGIAFRPLDAFVQGLPHHICAFLFPVHVGVYLVSVAMVMVWAVAIHDRVSFVRWKGINFTGHHTLHHWYSDYNFGQYTTVWDRLMGTYRDPEVEREEIPEGIVVRAQTALARAARASAPAMEESPEAAA